MERKPVVLIMTSTDEYGKVSEVLAEAIRKVGTHNVVVLNETRYDTRFNKISRLDGLMFLNDEYKLLVAKKTTPQQILKGKPSKKSADKLKGRVRRIANAVKRYNPEFLLTVTPYAHCAVAEAKERAGFGHNVINIPDSFVLRKHFAADGAADAYIVENGDIKAELVKNGVPSRKIMTMGLPLDAEKVTPIEVETKKQELGLPKTTTVFLNASAKDGVAETLKLLADQGSIVNVVCYFEDTRLTPSLRAIADAAESGGNNIVLLSKEEMFDEYLSVSDIVITRYDPSVLYKCFKMGKPVISFSDNDFAAANLDYLVSKNLVMRAADTIDVVALIYKLMQTDTASVFVENGEKWTEMYSVENIVNYLTSYIGT